MSPGNSRTRFLGALGLLAALSSGALFSGCGGETEVRPPQWSYIYPAIIQPSCATASCHSSFTTRAGVNFGYSDEAWFQMVCRHFVVKCFNVGDPDPCSTDPNAKIMTASSADCSTNAVAQSQVINQLSAQGASRMPPDFPLPNADIRLIEAWITAGAQND
jgi:hypothetical protein